MKVSRPCGLTLAMIAAGAALTLWCAPAFADPYAVNVTISNDEGTYSHDYLFTDSMFTPGPGGVINANQSTILAGDTNAKYSLDYLYNPTGHHLGINFTVEGLTEDSMTFSDTTVHITANSPTFSVIPSPDLRVSGSMIASNLFGGETLGEVATGLIPTGNMFQASFGNTNPTDHVFASIFEESDFDSPFPGSFHATRDTGFLPAGFSLGAMQSQWYFTLTSGSGANGTTEFDPVPVPEPSSLGLLALGSVAIMGLGNRWRKARA